MANHHVELFQRGHHNPILSASDWPYPVNSVFNPGAILLPDGTTLLLCRVEDRRGHSHLCAARSRPEGYPEELWGIEDPRITYIAELKNMQRETIFFSN
jgi:predicted GH43/DUF377 family glycosyl hydrolase